MFAAGEIDTAGADGASFTTRPVRAVEVPQLLVAVTEYVPGDTDVKLVVVIVAIVTEELLIRL